MRYPSGGSFEQKLAWVFTEHGWADVTWDSFGRCFSVLGASHLRVPALFTEIGPRAYNSPGWTGDQEP